MNFLAGDTPFGRGVYLKSGFGNPALAVNADAVSALVDSGDTFLDGKYFFAKIFEQHLLADRIIGHIRHMETPGCRLRSVDGFKRHVSLLCSFG
jgi:hypothetical protein